MSLKKYFPASVFVLAFGLVVSSFTLFPSYTFASNPSSFHISELQNGTFVEVYSPSFPVQYTTKNFNFNNLNNSLTLQINEGGDLPYSGVDAIMLNACGANISPSSAFYSETNESVLEDILNIDLNVIISHDKPIQISWNLPQDCSTATLSINANEYGVATPFRFPVDGNASYTLDSNNGSLIMDGKINETDGTTPLYTPYWIPSTGHPEGNVYLYAKDDSNYLYFAADIAIDNTNDIGPDWISITIGDKEFKVTDADNTYGKCSFGLTSKVSYKHQTCELKIPKNLISYSSSIPFVLGYYGTAGGLDISAPTFGPHIGTTGIQGGTTTVGVTVNDDVSVASAEISFDNGVTYVSMTETLASINRNPPTPTQRRYTYELDIPVDQATNIDYRIRASDVATNSATLEDTIIVTILPTFAGGLGTSGSPYQIATCQQLEDINFTPDAGATYPYVTGNKYFILNNNIPCEGTSTWNSNGDGGYYGFEPIGTFYNRFLGNFNGNNKKITGLYINRPELYHVGLFSLIDEGSNVYDLGVENVNITGNDYVGALAGSLIGTVTNVYSTGSVNGDSYSWHGVGGLVGKHADLSDLDNSSPLVYTWDGSKYEYVADVGKMLPKDVDGLDLAQIDSQNLVPKNDKYSMKISEEYNEIVYYDELALMTFDHEPGYTVVAPLNRDTKVEDLRTISDTPTNPLIACTDMYGNDCLDSLKAYDNKWNYKDKSFVNQWVLDFGNLANKDNIQLVMRAARDYNAGASGNYEKMRNIEVKDANGNWVKIYDKDSMKSDGTPRLRTVDLTGKFLSDDYRVRVTFGTQNVNYFAVDTSPQVPVTVNTYHPTKADLGFQGFTAINRTYFNDHDYSKISSTPEGLFANQYGNFTKYGDVSPLLETTNDQFVVMRYGDAMDVEFPYVAPAEGMERSFILYNDVLYKHATNDKIGDLGKTVSPLPYQGMTSYTKDTVYPVTPLNTEYLNNWNTRTYEGKPSTSGSTIIDSYSEANVSGGNYVGGLVGFNNKEIRGSYATGNVIGAVSVGGLVGYNDSAGTISNSYATGNVTSGDSSSETGGLVGNSYGNVDNSYATGNVIGVSHVGGLIGYNDNNNGGGNISNSYSVGNVTGDTNVGGLIGYNYGNVNNSYSTGDVTGVEEVGGLIGYQDNSGDGNISNSYSVGNVTGEYEVGGLIGYIDSTDYVSNSGWYKTPAETEANMQGIGYVSELDSGAEVTYTVIDKTVFYSKTYGVYTFIGDVWDFTTPIWYEYTDNYPQLKAQGEVEPLTITGYESADTEPTPNEPGTAGTYGDNNKVGTLDQDYWITALSLTEDGYDSQVFKVATNQTGITNPKFSVTWTGHGDTPTDKLVYISIWNFTTSAWEALDSQHCSDDCTLTGDKTGTKYKDADDNVWIWAKADKYVAPNEISNIIYNADNDGSMTWTTNFLGDSEVYVDSESHDSWQGFVDSQSGNNVHYSDSELTMSHSISAYPNSNTSNEYFMVRSTDENDNVVTSPLQGPVDVSSCPFIFSYNGNEYNFVTEASSPGILSLGTTKENWESTPFYKSTFYPNPLGLAKIGQDQLVPKTENGKTYYDIKSTFELNEVNYFDQASLLVYDHVSNVDVYPDYRQNGIVHSISTPATAPYSVTDQSGANVLNLVSSNDNHYWQSPLSSTPSYLDIKLLEQNDTPENLRIVIKKGKEGDFLNSMPGDKLQYKNENGEFVDVPASYNPFFATRPGAIAPSIIVANMNGVETKVIDLSGLNIKDNMIRLVTTNEKTQWDIDWLAVDTTPDNPGTPITLSPYSANLQYRGISGMELTNPSQSNMKAKQPNYEDLITSGIHSNPLTGNATKYGEVASLLSSVDNKFAVLVQGDELSLKYEVPAQAEGTVRDFIYSTFDYHKPYAYGLGGTIGPLPFNEMTQYPYRESEENYPYEANQSYINEYNTRIINWTGLSSDIIPNQIHHSLNTDYINVEVTEGTGTTTRSHITSSGSSAQAIAQFKAEQLQLVTPVVEPTPEPTTNLTPLNLSRTLRLNMTGDDVKALQTYLNTAGFNCGIVDGKFGPKTKAGVILFQKANGLVPDGIVGPLTMAKMK